MNLLIIVTRTYAAANSRDNRHSTDDEWVTKWNGVDVHLSNPQADELECLLEFPENRRLLVVHGYKERFEPNPHAPAQLAQEVLKSFKRRFPAFSNQNSVTRLASHSETDARKFEQELGPIFVEILVAKYSFTDSHLGGAIEELAEYAQPLQGKSQDALANDDEAANLFDEVWRRVALEDPEEVVLQFLHTCLTEKGLREWLRRGKVTGANQDVQALLEGVDSEDLLDPLSENENWDTIKPQLEKLLGESNEERRVELLASLRDNMLSWVNS